MHIRLKIIYMKQTLSSLFDRNNPKQMLLNGIFVLFLISLLSRIVLQLFSMANYGGTKDYEDWLISEFLINYQGGFVRRGLMGEILFFFAKHFNIDVVWTIKIFCLVCFVSVCIFFVKSFLKKGYSLYILPLCFFLSGNILFAGWIRKDCLFFCFFIPILWLYHKSNLSIMIKLLLINVLSVFIILSHEVFAFFALPILFLLFFNQYKSKGILLSVVLSLLCLLPSIFAFFLVFRMHGNPEIAQAIWDSWMAILNQETSNIGKAVDAISWSSKSTFALHLKGNFLSVDQRVLSLLIWVITFPVVYYISTNALLAFRKNENDFTNRHKTVLSSVLIFQLLCLSPVFVVLSCDYLRVFFYWITSSFTVFLLIPIDEIEKLFPAVFVHLVKRINKMLTNILQPSKTTLFFLMIFIGIANSSFTIEMAYKATVIYNVLVLLSQPLIFLFSLLHLM